MSSVTYGGILTLTGNTGGPIRPSGGNINVVGGTDITVVGSGNTLTISATGGLAGTYTTDSGNASPAASVLNILGSGGITTTGSGNTVTVVATPGGLVFVTVAINTAMVTNKGYFTAGGSQLLMQLPSSASVGDIVKIDDTGDAGTNSPFRITQAAGQQIFSSGSQSSTLGAGGYVEVVGGTADAKYSTVTLRCIAANTWIIESATANLNFV